MNQFKLCLRRQDDVTYEFTSEEHTRDEVLTMLRQQTAHVTDDGVYTCFGGTTKLIARVKEIDSHGQRIAWNPHVQGER